MRLNWYLKGSRCSRNICLGEEQRAAYEGACYRYFCSVTLLYGAVPKTKRDCNQCNHCCPGFPSEVCWLTVLSFWWSGFEIKVWILKSFMYFATDVGTVEDCCSSARVGDHSVLNWVKQTGWQSAAAAIKPKIVLFNPEKWLLITLSSGMFCSLGAISLTVICKIVFIHPFNWCISELWQFYLANNDKHRSDLLEDLDEIQNLGRRTVALYKTYREAPKLLSESKGSSQWKGLS